MLGLIVWAVEQISWVGSVIVCLCCGLSCRLTGGCASAWLWHSFWAGSEGTLEQWNDISQINVLLSMSFFYSAHKELNGLYWALGATCWAQQLLGLFLLWPFLFCACSTPVFLIEICVSLKCFTFWLTIIALWEIEFDPSVEARQVESVSVKAVCRGWLVTWGANWSAVETVRAVSGVTMDSSWRYKPSCLLHAMSLHQRHLGTFSVTVDRWALY